MSFIVLIFLDLVISILCLRFLVNSLYLINNYYAALLNHYTRPIVMPFKFLFPKSRYDWSALLAALILATFTSYLRLKYAGFELKNLFFVLSFSTVSTILFTFLNIYSYLLVIMVIASWLQTPSNHQLIYIVNSLLRWLIHPVKRFLPTQAGAFDFAPLIVMLILFMVKYLIALLEQNIILSNLLM